MIKEYNGNLVSIVVPVYNVKKYLENGIKDELTENIIKYNSDSIVC